MNVSTEQEQIVVWVRDGYQPISRANPYPEEPDALIALVRICGGAGWVTTGSTRTVDRITLN